MKVQELILQCRNGSVQQKCSAIVDIEEMGATEALPVLLELLTFPDEGVRANAAHALGELGDRGASPKLLSSLKDSSSLVRLNAIESLGLLQSVESMHEISRLLQTDEDPLVRLQAAETLRMFNEPSVLPPLIEALNDPDAGVRAYAADSIGHLRVANAASSLIQQLSSEQSLFVRAYLLSALYQLGNTSALTSLIELIESADNVLAVTLLNLAAELATSQNATDIKTLIMKIIQSRTALDAEVASLIKRLDSLQTHD